MFRCCFAKPADEQVTEIIVQPDYNPAVYEEFYQERDQNRLEPDFLNSTRPSNCDEETSSADSQIMLEYDSSSSQACDISDKSKRRVSIREPCEDVFETPYGASRAKMTPTVETVEEMTPNVETVEDDECTTDIESPDPLPTTPTIQSPINKKGSLTIPLTGQLSQWPLPNNEMNKVPAPKISHVQEIQQKLLPSPKPKASPRPKSLDKHQIKDNYSSNYNGLRATGASTMVDTIDPKLKKELVTAINFVREISEKDVRDCPDAVNREMAFILYIFIKTVALESDKQNAGTTLLTHIIVNSEGEKALATVKVQAAAKKLQFMTNAYYKHIIDNLRNVKNPNRTVAQKVCDLHSRANVLMGDKPPSLNDRLNPFLADVLGKWNWEKCKEWQSSSKSDFNNELEKLIQAFENCRKSGTSYLEVAKKIQARISI